jgi:transposase
MLERAAELAATTGEKADPASLLRWLIRAGCRFKKTLRASEHDRPDVKQAREEWIGVRQPEMRLEPHRLVFFDETGTTTKMTRLRGCCPKGQRLLSKVPFGHWKTQTFIAGFRCGVLTAPFVVDALMDRHIFETSVETQLAPTLQAGDLVILDNLPAHKSAAAEAAIRAKGAWLLFLPPYSPELNPIEMAFAKLKALLRAGRSGPSTPSGAPSAKSAISSLRRMPELLRRRRIRIHIKIRRSGETQTPPHAGGLSWSAPGAPRSGIIHNNPATTARSSAVRRASRKPAFRCTIFRISP